MKRSGLLLLAFLAGLACSGTLFAYLARVERSRLLARLEEETQRSHVEALLPYCLASARADPHRFARLLDLRAKPREEGILAIMAAGWATPLGTTAPDRTLAERCYDHVQS